MKGALFDEEKINARIGGMFARTSGVWSKR